MNVLCDAAVVILLDDVVGLLIDTATRNLSSLFNEVNFDESFTTWVLVSGVCFCSGSLLLHSGFNGNVDSLILS